ncbi:MAG: ankyrin repeat domain-containing protein [Acidobacteria bacterium]|nr:ankyrin repeat domain-containing protein [Acidobacteriota bacterium]
MIAVTREHLRQKHPRLRGLSVVEAENEGLSLADAQFLIAREYGFESWSGFRKSIEETLKSECGSENTEPDTTVPNLFLDARDPVALSVVKAIQDGNVDVLIRLLEATPNLARARIRDEANPKMARSLLHIATDWPGHFPGVAETIDALVAAGAETDAPFVGGPHRETALHWAASSDDLAALNALLDAGANIEAKGAVIAGGSPIADAVAFGQWNAAARLAELGAEMNADHEAALGYLKRIQKRWSDAKPTSAEIDQAFWFACHGGQRRVAEHLLELGADPNWSPAWEKKTAREAAIRSGFADLADWIQRIRTK